MGLVWSGNPDHGNDRNRSTNLNTMSAIFDPRANFYSLQKEPRPQDKATLASSVGMECNFWGGEVETRFKKTPPTVRLLGETPGSFPARNWSLLEGRALADSDVEGAREPQEARALQKLLFQAPIWKLPKRW